MENNSLINSLSNSYANHRIDDSENCNPEKGSVVWSPVKSLWLSSMFLIALIGGVKTYSIEALIVFLSTSAITLCLGHSLGMHRLLIHKSYQCPKWLEYLLVHFGVLVGLAGPKGMMFTHDMRDWAQRQPSCHDYFSHKQPFFIDGLWQLHCDLILERPPKFAAEVEFNADKTYLWMEKYWLWQQLPWAILLFVIGGMPWVIWGICMRVVVSITGHWLIGYFAHNQGERDWHVKGAAVQGFNVKFVSLITMGESWHNNHHAFPGSALLGLEKGQMDPGWWVLRLLQKLGLVWNLKLPEDLGTRVELVAIDKKEKNLSVSEQLSF
jgi:fatty-acid desaturase